MTSGQSGGEGQPFYTVQIIAGALMMSALVYGAVILILQQSGFKPQDGQNLEMLKYVLAGMAAVAVVAAFAVRSLFLDPDRTARKLPSAATTQPRPDPSGRGPVPPVLFQIFLQGHIICFVLAESSAVFGLVVYIVNGDQNFAFGMIALSLLGMALLFPRRRAFDDLRERAEQAQMMGGSGRS